MNIRPYTPNDFEALTAIYRDAVAGIGATAYSPEQVRVWAGFATDHDAFRLRLSQGFALVAACDGVPAAFCHLHPIDHISLLYTATKFARQGLATAVYVGCEERARAAGQRRLTTDASKLSRPFFEGQGFVVCAIEVVDREGVSFERYTMEKTL